MSKDSDPARILKYFRPPVPIDIRTERIFKYCYCPFEEWLGVLHKEEAKSAVRACHANVRC